MEGDSQSHAEPSQVSTLTWLLLRFIVVGVGIHMHVHSGPHVVGRLCVGVDMSHPTEDHWNPKSMRLFTCLFGVDTPLWAKLRARSPSLFQGHAPLSAAKINVPVPGRDA